MARYDIGAVIGIEGEKELRDAIRQVNQSLSTLRTEMLAVSSSFEKGEKSNESLTAKNTVLTKQIEAQRTKLSELERGLSASADKYGENDKVTQSWQRAVNKATAELNNMERELDENNRALGSLNEEAKKRALEEYAKQAERVGEAAKKAVDVGLKIATAALAAFTAAAVAGGKAIMESLKVHSSFEDSMRQVQATMGLAGAEGEAAYNRLADAAKAAGESTRFTAAESAGALNNLALAGYDVTKAVDTLPKVLALAAAGSLDLGNASRIVTDGMAALRLEGSELSLFIDQIAKTSQKSNTSIAQLGEAVLVAGGQARLAGMSLEDMNTSLGILADIGLKGSEGGTALRNTLKNLYTPTSAAAKAMAELGVVTANSDGSLRGIQDVLGDLSRALDGLTAEERMNVMARIFDTRTIAAGNALIQYSGERFSELKSHIEGAAGAADQMARTMESGLAGSIRSLNSALESVSINMGQQFSNAAQNVVQSATGLVRRISEVISSGLAGSQVRAAAERLSAAISKVIDRLAATVDKWLPKLMDGLAWFIGNGQRVFATLLSIVAALTALKVALSIAATFKAVQAGIAAYTAAQTAATAATSAATVATTGLNAALAMNPVGALIAVLAAVVVGLATFAATAGDARSATGEFAQSVEKLTGSSARLVDSSRALSESHLASIEAMSSEARGADVLADRISALAAKESLSSAEKKTLVAYIDELNQRVPELSLAYNEQTGELTKNVDAIKRVIEERKKEAQLKRAIDDLIESERLLEEVKQKRTEVENALTEATERYNAALIEGVYQGGVSVQTKQEEYAAQQALLEQYDALTFELGELQIVMDSANLTIDTMAQAASSAAVSQQELTDAVSATPEQLEEAQARYQVYAEYTQGLFSTLAETVSSSTAKSAAELAQSMLDNQAVIEQWSINLNTLAQRGLDEGLIRQLREAGPESAKQVQALVNAQDTELLRLNDVYRSGAEVATQSFAAELGMESFLSSGSNAISKIAERVSSNDSLRSASVRQIANAFSAMQGEVNSRGWYSLGEQMAQGVINGVTSKSSSAMAAMRRLVSNMLAAGRTAAEVRSPSKLFRRELGYEMGLGTVLGMTDAIEESGRAIQQAMQNVTNNNSVTNSHYETNLGGLNVNVYGNADSQTASAIGRAAGNDLAMKLRWKGVPAW